jgi:8-oxo-dGTP diphosphatase
MPSANEFRFNIRVYGLMVMDGNLLLSDEYFNGIKMTKFPGGGLNYGEGTIDCLKREALEEFDTTIEILGHFYTTDYFQPALFFENTQLISIYYRVRINNLPDIPVCVEPFLADEKNPQYLRWVPLHQLDEVQLTFPIDRKVASLLKNQLG